MCEVNMSDLEVNAARLLERIRELGKIGCDTEDNRTRLAFSDADRLGRDQFVEWIKQAGLDLAIDRIGNVFGIWNPGCDPDVLPVMMGSHIDSVINAGMFDGCYGVLAGLEVIERLKEAGFSPVRPIVVGAFSNEEGVRFAPDMMGSITFAGGMSVEDALATVGTDGTTVEAELIRIGYAGEHSPGFLKPHVFVELHIEQGPVLEREGIPIGVVENLQGISWQRVTIEGVANHSGTTPMSMRCDAGHAAARVITFVHDRAEVSNSPMVATVGCIAFEPNAINVIPSKAVFTVDLRDPDDALLRGEEVALQNFLDDLPRSEGVTVEVERLVRFEPVTFDATIVGVIEKAAQKRGLASRRMTSGAGHDAQMMTRIAPSAMIFVPSVKGISHNKREFTADEDLIAGANVLLDVVKTLSSKA